MKELYKSLVAQLQAVGIKWIDFDIGQLESSESRVPLAFPSALLAFGFSTSDVTESIEQREQGSITIRLAFDGIGSRTSGGAPESAFNRSLAWLSIADATYTALQGYEPAGFDAMECTSRQQEPRSDGVIVWRLQFSTARWLL